MTFRLNSLELQTFADALMTVPAADRPTLMRTLIKRSADVAERLRGHRVTTCWNAEIASVCHAHRRECETATGTFYRAGITDRDGIQAFEVALAAMLDMVREDEKEGAL